MTFGRVFSLFALSRHFLKIGGALTKIKLKFVFVFGLHYAGLQPKIGGALTKIKLKFVFVFGLHYLCRIIQQN